MAQRLRDSFGPPTVQWVAAALAEQLPDLDRDAFFVACLDGFAELELTARAQRIADVMAGHLPEDPHLTIPLLTRAMGPVDDAVGGMASFRYLPFGIYIGEHGQAAFEESMVALRELTLRFTAEFSVRPFLVHQPERTLARLYEWTGDADPRVRRAASEGTRPRLPWAPRLKAFVADPAPVLVLLERLRDDPSEMVRRSVANNLNDIAKDHPDLVLEVARRWWADGDLQRRRLVRHALRTLVKAGDPDALSILGHEAGDHLRVVGASIAPAVATIGGKVRIQVDVADDRTTGAGQRVATDVLVHFVKSSGRTAPKVFKGGERELAPGDVARFTVTISVAQHTTRKHFPGRHQVDAQVNGVRWPVGSFDLIASPTG